MNARQNTFPANIRLISPTLVDPFIWWAIATSLLCVLGPLRIDWVETIPITLQTLVVMLLPVLFGTRIGTFAVLGYLVAGGLGAPVFSGGNGGWEVFTGPTGGFLIGFLPAAWLTGNMVHSRWGQRWLAIALSVLAGHQVVLLFGLPWFGWQSGWEKVLPVWSDLTPGMLVKTALATVIAFVVRWGLKRGIGE